MFLLVSAITIVHKNLSNFSVVIDEMKFVFYIELLHGNGYSIGYNLKSNFLLFLL